MIVSYPHGIFDCLVFYVRVRYCEHIEALGSVRAAPRNDKDSSVHSKDESGDLMRYVDGDRWKICN